MNRSANWLRVALVVVCMTGGILAISKAFASSSQDFYGTVTKVVDGDTVHFKNVNARKNTPDMRIRLVHIDTPETHLETSRGTQSQGYWGEEAAAQLERLIPVNTPVKVVSSEVDKYGRVLGRIYSGERDVNLKMVTLGLAIPYIICSGPTCQPGYMEDENLDEYFKACDEARDSQIGVFDSENPLTEMPFEFRMRMQHRKPERFVGDYESHKLYAPRDYKKVDVCRRVFFDKEADAIKLGFRY